MIQLGNIAQELGDVAIKAAKGKRYFRQARDRFWGKTESQPVKDAIKKELGQDISSVDTAFDYCLTRLRDRFPKREAFVATSDLCRSFAILSVLALVPAVRTAFYDIHPGSKSIVAFAILFLLLMTIATLAWKRMVRFRELSRRHVYGNTDRR